MNNDYDLLLRGIVMGFSIAAPVGPIGVLCIRRTLAGGRLSGFVSGLGAASADAIYGCVAAFGLTFVSAWLIQAQTPLRLAGGLYLAYLGVRTFTAQPAAVDATPVAPARGLAGAYGSTLALTLTNPMTILSFAAIFAGLGASSASGSGSGSAALLVLGVFAGSALWWLILSAASSLLRTRLHSPPAMLWVNRLSGLIIAGFGVAALLTILSFGNR